MKMKQKTNLILVLIMAVSSVACVVLWQIEILWVFVLSAVPFFCVQLLLCRLVPRWWVRILPMVPIVVLAGAALYLLIRDSGWDRLGALIFGLATIAPMVGTALGWGIWAFCLWRGKRCKQ
jgi:hypothetical protein